MATPLLPDQFSALERFIGKWDLPDINARYAMRLETPIAQQQEFNDAIVADAEAIKTHLDSKPFADWDDADRRLARLMFAFTLVAQAVQVYKQPAVPDSGSVAALDVTMEPGPKA